MTAAVRLIAGTAPNCTIRERITVASRWLPPRMRTRREAHGPDRRAGCRVGGDEGGWITVTTSMVSGADFSVPGSMWSARRSMVPSSSTGVPSSLARCSFRESGRPGFAMTMPVLPLTLFMTSRPASDSRRASSVRGTVVGPVMATLVPWMRPTAGSNRPGSRHGQGTRVTLSGKARELTPQATTGSRRPSVSARSRLRRNTSARVRTSSRASWAARCRIPQYVASVPSLTLGTSSWSRRASVTVHRR